MQPPKITVELTERELTCMVDGYDRNLALLEFYAEIEDLFIGERYFGDSREEHKSLMRAYRSYKKCRDRLGGEGYEQC